MKTILKKFYILGVLLIGLISVSLFIQFSYLNNINIKDKEINMEKSREIMGQEINNALRLRSQMILSISELVSTNYWSKTDTENYFKRLIEENPILGSIYYVDTNNNLITSNDWIPPENYDPGKRIWYIKAVEEKDMVWSQAYVDAYTNRIIVTVSKPVYNTVGELKGVAAGDVSIEEIMEFVHDANRDNIGECFLIDGEGYIIAHPNYTYDKYYKFKNIDKLFPDTFDEIKTKGIGRKQVVVDGIDGYLSYETIEETDLIIANFSTFEDYYQNDNHLLKIFLITLFMTIIIFVGFLFLQNKHFLKPLYRLEKDVGSINVKKNIAYRIGLDESDPFLDLRKSININLDKTEELFLQQKEYQEELLASHEELEAAYGQLSAMEGELREQYRELKENEERLYNLSYRDQLTGLYNRRYFTERLTRLDREENLPLTLIMADVNGLKLINDSFGHGVGDKLLKNVGNAMKNSCRGNQIVFRIGGDEFIIILPKTPEEESEKMIRDIRRLADQDNLHNIELSISFGVATKYNKDEDISEVLKKAEDHMYSNKLVEGPSMRSRTIDTIIQTLYEKSPREEAHSTRVSLLCQQMGIYIGMSEEKIKELEMVGLLHDIGKVAISDTILEKPGALSDEEWKEMKRHPEVGYRILSTTSEMATISEYVLAHHERWDGKGYPKGIEGEDIPIVSRIIAIADAYDAMISDRPYRKGLAEEVAVGEIIKNAGTQFDPILAQVFVEKVLGKEWIE